MIRTLFRRFAIFVVVVVALAIVALAFYGWAVLKSISHAAANRLANQGLSAAAEDPLHIFAGYYVPLRSPSRIDISQGNLDVDFAKASDLPAMCETAARLGEYELVLLKNHLALHAPYAGKIIDSARPGQIFVRGSEFTPGLAATLNRNAPLEYLSVFQCRIPPGAFESLRGGQKISYLWINESPLDAAAMATLIGLPEIAGLGIGNGVMTSLPDPTLAVAATLRDINLPGDLAGASQWIGAVKSLTTLRLTGNSTKFDPAVLATLPNLTTVMLDDASIDDAWLDRLPVLPHVLEFSVRGNPLTDAGLTTVLHRCPRLRTLNPGGSKSSLGAVKALQLEYPHVAIGS